MAEPVAPVTEITEETVNAEIERINGIIDSNGVKIEAIKGIITSLYKNIDNLTIENEDNTAEALKKKEDYDTNKEEYDKKSKELEETIIKLTTDIKETTGLTQQEKEKLNKDIEVLLQEKANLEKSEKSFMDSNVEKDEQIKNLKTIIEQYKKAIQNINNNLATTETKVNQEQIGLESIVTDYNNKVKQHQGGKTKRKNMRFKKGKKTKKRNRIHKKSR